MPNLCLKKLTVSPLRVPLTVPFVIATGRVDATPNALVRIDVQDRDTGLTWQGLGEAATLPPVTEEALDDVLRALTRLARELPLDLGEVAGPDEALAVLVQRARVPWLGPVARMGLDMALHDALGRRAGLPVYALLDSAAQSVALRTDITLAIGEPAAMGQLAERWAASGFDTFKVKVGRDLSADVAALLAIQAQVPAARLRIDANAGYEVGAALALCAAIERHGLQVECFEQPCGADDFDGLRAVTAAVPFDVLADESCQGYEAVCRLVEAGAVDGVNLKLAKCGGLMHALAAGRLARQHGLSLMVGSMVETRLGVTAAAHLAAALGGVEYADLDTAWLLTEEPWVGGYVADGPNYAVPAAAGLGIAEAFGPGGPAD